MAIAGGGAIKAIEPVVELIDESSGLYLGAGVSAASTREASLNFFEDKSGQDRTLEMTLLAGYDFNKYIGVEGRYYKSVAKEDIVDRSSWGIFVKPHVPVSETLNLYVLAGYGGFKGESINGSNVDIDDTGFQLGVGASYKVMDNVSIFADWVSIVYDEQQDAFITAPDVISMDTFTLGVLYKF